MKKDNAEKYQSVDGSRRKALKTMAGAGAVAGLLAVSDKWSKPVVDSIILPAHAQATNVNVPSPTTTIVQNNATENIIYCQCNFASVSVPPYEVAPISASDPSAKQQ